MAAQSTKDEHLAVILILDDSGSMKASDPTDLRYTWGVKLRDYDSHFQNITLPIAINRLKDNKFQYEANLVETLRKSLDILPLETELYPGGLDNANSVLELFSKHFENIGHDLVNLMVELMENQSIISDKLDIKIQDMQSLLAEAPNLPHWVRILPTFIRKWIAPFVMTRQYGREIYMARNLRNECQEFLQQICGLRIEQEALSFIKEILPVLLTQVKETQSDLELYMNKLTHSLKSFSKTWEKFPLASEENGWDEIFRKPVADSVLSNWAYNKWLPNLDVWVHEFTTAQPLFEDWRNVRSKTISAWVLEKSARTYQPVWKIDLDAIFGLWVDQKSGFANGKLLTSKSITTCMSAAIPLIRPNFDAVGGPKGSSVSFHALTGSQDWRFCRRSTAKNGINKWQDVLTGDPYTALLIQVHHNIPLKSLMAIFQSAQFRLENMPMEKQDKCQLKI